MTTTTSATRPVHRRLLAPLLTVFLASTVLLSGCLPAPLMTITTFAGTGAAGSTGDGGPATAATFRNARGVATDPDGNVYISDMDSYRVRKVDTAGVITTIAGTGVKGYTGDGGPATSAQIGQAIGVAADGDGNVYFTEFDHHTVRKVDESGVITTIAGTGVGTFAGDNGPATEAGLYGPAGVAVDAAGVIYIADGLNNRIRRIDTAGTITTFAGDGFPDIGGDGGVATSAHLYFPAGVAADNYGRVYIADMFNNRVRRVQDGIITTVAGTGNNAYSGDGGPAVDAELNFPEAVAVDRNATLFIADTQNHRVRRVEVTGIISTVVGNGTGGFGGDGGAATAAKLRQPTGLALIGDDMYVADIANRRVRKVANNAVIGGSVVADIGGAPMSGLIVRLYRSTDTTSPILATTTNTNGEYAFQVPEPGDYRIQFVGTATHQGEWYDDRPGPSTSAIVHVERFEQFTSDASLATRP